MATTEDITRHPDERAHEFEERLRRLRRDLREEIGELADPQAKALFETAAEVLGGLEMAFSHYRSKSEEAWRPSAPVLG